MRQPNGKKINSTRSRRKKRPGRLDRFLLFLTGLLVIATLAIYAWPQIQPYLAGWQEKPDWVRSHVVIEAGESFIIEDFLLEPVSDATWLDDPAQIDMRSPGIYPLQIRIDSHVYDTSLEVTDTIPPRATPVDRTFWQDEPFSAADFVTDIEDQTRVDITYETAPDLTRAGEQEVVLVLTDAGRNQTRLKTTLNLLIDNEPPRIFGVENRTVFLGSTIAYSQGITVTDNRDETVELEIDNSRVNLRQEGTYPVVYRATDQAGNQTEVKATVTVVEQVPNSIDPAELEQLADDILAEILTDGMSAVEQAEAIYWWTKEHIRYVNESDKSSWLNAAHHGITMANGDCFNYFAVAKILLTRAGIENIDIYKTGGGHYWSMINLGDGWYHFDTTPRRAGGEFFMLTDAELQAYSDDHNDSHIWDRDRYPATPED